MKEPKAAPAETAEESRRRQGDDLVRLFEEQLRQLEANPAKTPDEAKLHRLLAEGLREIREGREQIEAQRQKFAADKAEVLATLRGDYGLVPSMARAEALLRRHVPYGDDDDRSLQSLVEFVAEEDDSILAPSVLIAILTLRSALSRMVKGSPQERRHSVHLRRLLEKLLLAYARPAPSSETKRLEKSIRMETARTAALLDVIKNGEKLTVALARAAAKYGVAKSKPDANPWTSRAEQRAEQRLRKKAGEPPRPRGRPPRPR